LFIGADRGNRPAHRPGEMSAAMPLQLVTSEELARMKVNAAEAAALLKAISHEGRLMILCHLVHGEKSVTELENLLASRQAAVSQQLALLRLEGLVTARREGKAIYYALADDRSRRVVLALYEIYCT
jgi:ArsR family transcriptional regulator